MSDLHSIGWYSSQISPHLPREAFKSAPIRLWGGLVYLVTTVTGIAAIGTMNLHPLLNLAIAVVIGAGFAGLGFLGHEILHGTVVKRAWLRDLLGAVCFAQFNLGPKLWRKWHNMEHHGHTQDEDFDPDAWATMEEIYKRPGMRFVYKLHPYFRSFVTFSSFTVFFSLHSLIMLRRFYSSFKPKDRPIVLLQLLAPAALWITLLVLMGPAKWFFAFLLPLFMANFMVIAYISTNHQLNPLTDVNDPLANSLSVTVPRWVDVLHFNFSFHTEHHLFPGVNSKWGPLIKQKVKDLWPDRYHEMTFVQALVALWRTPRMYQNNTQLVDPYHGVTFDTLGHGMNPSRVTPRVLENQNRPTKPVVVSTLENQTQGD